MKQRTAKLWWLLFAASSVGLISSLVQTIELISYRSQPATKLICDVNAVFSCSSVFDAWQSRVFGFSNSLVCLTFFGLSAGIALAAATGSELNKKLRFVFHFLSVFFLGLGAWYLWQSTYKIGAICMFCLFCYAAVIAMNWAWFRLNYEQLSASKKVQQRLSGAVRSNVDVLIAVLWACMIAIMITSHFYLG